MREVPYLRLVPDANERSQEAEERVERGTAQLSLFPFTSSNTIVVVVMEVVPGGRFASLVANLRPTLVVDVRSYPRFDMPGYDRAAAFRDFRRVHAQYLHVARDVGVPEHLAGRATGAASRQIAERPLSGPIMVLCDTTSNAEPLLTQLTSMPHPASDEGWSIWTER